jgi:hypothetical protein
VVVAASAAGLATRPCATSSTYDFGAASPGLVGSGRFVIVKLLAFKSPPRVLLLIVCVSVVPTTSPVTP